MATTALIDYGCHSFTFRLACHLHAQGCSIEYIANGSLESPNLASLPTWQAEYPALVRLVRTSEPYGKLNLSKRLRGELEWASRCIELLERDQPSSIVASCLPLPVVSRIQSWARRNGIPFVYWLQDLQSIAIAELLGKRFGIAGQAMGRIAKGLELKFLNRSNHVITIAHAHESFLPAGVQRDGRFTTLENWANIEDIPELPANNQWAARRGLDKTRNVVYSGTLGFKHDLAVFLSLAESLADQPDIRIVVVSSGAAADHIRSAALVANLRNVVVLPFQPYESLPSVLASASVLIAPLDPAAGSFCVPSKVLSYLCAGRPCVLALDGSNPAAQMVARAGAGITVRPGNSASFLKAVRGLMDDAPLRRRLGRSARTYAEATFGIQQVSTRFIQILEQSGIKVAAGRLHPAYATVRQSAAS